MISRWIRFLLVMLLGAAGGLFYGWQLNPVQYVDTTPDTLRNDYKTDYVLMVAEAYSLEGDLEMAVRRLALLGDSMPSESVRAAILFAEGAGYYDVDISLMRALSTDLQLWNPGLGDSVP